MPSPLLAAAPSAAAEPADGAADHHSGSFADDVPAFRGSHAPGRSALLAVAGTWIALVALAVLVGRALGDATSVDRSAAEWLVDQRTDALNAATRLFSLAGDTYTVIGIAALVVIVGFVRHRREGLIVLVVGMLGEVTIFLTVTALVSRDRPDVVHLDGAPPTSSFPSGHTFAAIVLWGSLAVVASRSRWQPWLRDLFLFLMVMMPVAIGLSRLYRGMHHLTDVLASVVLGVVWLFLVVTVFPARARGADELSESAR
jgi:undecaprenyl-diphosphatase